MVFGLFAKKCALCGQDIKKGKEIKSFNKYMCSEKHAEKYGVNLIKAKSESKKVVVAVVDNIL